jgi:hypothetical protein
MLESTTFSAKPTFDALSYAWGDGNETERIKVNGATVNITEDLGTPYIIFDGQVKCIWFASRESPVMARQE